MQNHGQLSFSVGNALEAAKNCRRRTSALQQFSYSLASYN